jgi:hypothetical protein
LKRAWFLWMLTPPKIISGFGSSDFLPTVTGTIKFQWNKNAITYNNSFQNTNVKIIKSLHSNLSDEELFYFPFSFFLLFIVLSLNQSFSTATIYNQNFLCHQFTTQHDQVIQLCPVLSPFPNLKYWLFHYLMLLKAINF